MTHDDVILIVNAINGLRGEIAWSTVLLMCMLLFKNMGGRS
jgi:hypothetical protein